MKKLSVLIALALVLTIGGAYATWTYAAGGAQGTSGSVEIGMGTLETDGDISIGSFAITSKPTLTVEPKVDKSDYTTTLNVTGDLVITFTPSASAQQTIKENGTPVNVTIEVGAGNQYDGKTLLTLADGADNVFEFAGGLTVTITAAQLSAILDLEGIELNTVAAYNDYAAILEGYSINVTVTPQT